MVLISVVRNRMKMEGLPFLLQPRESGEKTPSQLFSTRKWICEYASSEAQTAVNHNKHITDKLEVYHLVKGPLLYHATVIL